ncbi:hypothetical protein [Mesobacillus jeotgali]|jgi:hypothetical protein|uniref:hypothetical protein n=1 Tax=Mesobacillus jeotgali TaxID=129985 RepID=UPI001CFD9786|nr:hypothetical protein [Mesobacillus jeotgali]
MLQVLKSMPVDKVISLLSENQQFREAFIRFAEKHGVTIIKGLFGIAILKILKEILEEREVTLKFTNGDTQVEFDAK